METERWKTIERLFFEASEQPAVNRKSFLLRATGDSALVAEVLSLLDAEEDADRVLEDVVGSQVTEWAASAAGCGVEAGFRLGPYRLLEELSSGGMGTVHLAQRVDDQYDQIVAIKTVRSGFPTVDLIHRFRGERQILATLNHPNIGAILDGGETRDGLPFLVMEYVEGETITTFCRKQQMSVRARLQLFRSACSAVYHAHQKLILHRDIKPENVLVTREGHLKLIDFGIAKYLGVAGPAGSGVDAGATTQWLTPNYASPEQIQGKPLSVVSDVYCLGVLLYEVLTDARPYDLNGLTPVEAERALVSQTIRRPSVVVADGNRRREISGDLDRIVLMAMEASPERRYQSVQHFSDDLVRFLEGQPVLAHRSSFPYVVTKAIGRHRTLLLSVCVCLVVLLGSYTGYRWRLRVSNKNVEEVRELAQSTIDELMDSAGQNGSTTEMKAAVSRRGLDYLNKLAGTSSRDPRLLLHISRLYIRVGDLEGLPSMSNLGHAEEAARSYQGALRSAEAADSQLHNAETTVALVTALGRVAALQTSQLDITGASTTYKRALSLAYPFWQQDPNALPRQQALISVYRGIGKDALLQLQPDVALMRFDESLHILNGRPDGVLDHDLLLANLLLNRSDALNDLGKQKESVDAALLAVSIAQDLSQVFPREKPRRTLRAAYVSLVEILAGRDFINSGDSKRAEMYAGRLLSLSRLLDPHDSTNIQARLDRIEALTAMADARRLQDAAAAILWYGKALTMANELPSSLGQERQHVIAVLEESLAEVLPSHSAERAALLADHERIREEQAGFTPHGLLHLMAANYKLADAALANGRPDEAQRFMARAYPLLSQYDTHSPSLLVLRNVALCLRTEGELHLTLMQGAAMSTRSAEASAAIDTLERSRHIWITWSERGADSPESVREAQRVAKDIRRVCAIVRPAGRAESCSVSKN